MSAGVSVRRMAESDLALALEWAAEEGWNPGLRDAECFYAADPEGFFVAEFDGEPVGSISAVRYGPDFGFLGLYIVRPGFRGRGFGLKLWRRAMEHFGERNVGLDGVVAQQANYRKSGFHFAHRNIRQRGEGGGDDPGGLADLASVPLGEIARYDATAFPALRPGFLSAWVRQPGAVALAALDAGALTGFGLMRPCREGFKIGPLLADDPEIADALLRGLRARAGGDPVFLDTPEVNPAAVALAKRHGMAPVFETARMYTKAAPEVRLDRCFGVTTFELG